jgi:hypothetical protein
MAAYVLVELPETRVRQLVLDAYNKARQTLLFVEPGTPSGFARIRMARDVLIERGAALPPLSSLPDDESRLVSFLGAAAAFTRS